MYHSAAQLSLARMSSKRGLASILRNAVAQSQPCSRRQIATGTARCMLRRSSSKPLLRMNALPYCWSQRSYSTRESTSLEVDLSEPPVRPNIEIPFTMYNATDTTMVNGKMTKHDLATKYGFSMRDLRNIDMSSHDSSHISVRPNTLMVRISSLHLLIQADKVLHLHGEQGSDVPESNISRVFSRIVQKRLHEHLVSITTKELPFELRVVEIALLSGALIIEAELAKAKQKVSEILSDMDEHLRGQDERYIYSDLLGILDLVRELTRIGSRAQQFQNATQNILSDDEDMASMYLSDRAAGKPHTVQDHQEVEYLFEAYYQTSDTVVRGVQSLTQSIERTEETVQSVLNLRRNQIMVLEAKIEIIMVALASATLVAGLYGMNTVNFLEESEWGFGGLTALSLVGILFISRYGLRRLKRIQCSSVNLGGKRSLTLSPVSTKGSK